MGNFLKSCFKLIFGILLKPKSLFLLDMLKLMRQWLKISFKGEARLTFDLSAKVAHIGVPSTYLNIVFSETTRPMEIKFHMTTPYDWLAKICTN